MLKSPGRKKKTKTLVILPLPYCISFLSCISYHNTSAHQFQRLDHVIVMLESSMNSECLYSTICYHQLQKVAAQSQFPGGKWSWKTQHNFASLLQISSGLAKLERSSEPSSSIVQYIFNGFQDHALDLLLSDSKTVVLRSVLFLLTKHNSNHITKKTDLSLSHQTQEGYRSKVYIFLCFKRRPFNFQPYINGHRSTYSGIKFLFIFDTYEISGQSSYCWIWLVLSCIAELALTGGSPWQPLLNKDMNTFVEKGLSRAAHRRWSQITDEEDKKIGLWIQVRGNSL